MWEWVIFLKKTEKMSVRTRITILFAGIVLGILLLVCGSVYYFSYTSRVNNIKTRLKNWAITTGRLLSLSGTFDPQMVHKIDASTVFAMKDKSVQAFDFSNARKFIYSDDTNHVLPIDREILDKARSGTDVYFKTGGRECIAHHYTDGNLRVVMVASADDAEGKKKLMQLQYILLFSFAGGIFVSVGVGYLFSKSLLTPLRKIADEVNEISVQNLARRIKAGSGSDEWNYLAGTLNQLLNRLKESFEIQRRFISNASHELSTPLTSISSQLEISLQRNREASEYRKVMESIYQDVRKLGRLTQTLLEFARASGDPGGIEIDLLRIDEILLALPSEISKLNKSYAVVLTFDQLPEEVEKLLVFGNEDLLFTAIKNIALNACKYSGNHVAKVGLSFRENIMTICIEDEGKGIERKEFENIFQPFYRVSDNHTELEGFGLGLALAQQIIELHKGHIKIQSNVNVGTTVTIQLPSAGNLSRSHSP